MSIISIDTSELNALAVDLGRASGQVHAVARTAVTKTAHEIEADAKAFAPVDTGNLRGSISASVNGLNAEIGPTAAYGVYVEFGTSKMAPHAYMGPAFDRRAPELVSALSQAAGSVL